MNTLIKSLNELPINKRRIKRWIQRWCVEEESMRLFRAKQTVSRYARWMHGPDHRWEPWVLIMNAGFAVEESRQDRARTWSIDGSAGTGWVATTQALIVADSQRARRIAHCCVVDLLGIPLIGSVPANQQVILDLLEELQHPHLNTVRRVFESNMGY